MKVPNSFIYKGLGASKIFNFLLDLILYISYNIYVRSKGRAKD